MLERIFALLRRRLTAPSPDRQFRPNELRLEGVRAERQRRAAMQADMSARASRPSLEEERTPRERPQVLPDDQATTRRPLPMMLKSRSGLRQAWVVKEILGPPVALRGPHDDG